MYVPLVERMSFLLGLGGRLGWNRWGHILPLVHRFILLVRDIMLVVLCVRILGMVGDLVLIRVALLNLSFLRRQNPRWLFYSEL